MKNKIHQTVLLAYSGLAIVVGLVIFLLIEAYFFVHHARELVRLKEDYANYTLALKRMIAECEQDRQEQAGLKKKMTNEDEFITVNRDFDYLVQSAVLYAQQYHLEDVVQQLYKNRDWTLPTPRKKTEAKPRLRRQQQGHVFALDNSIVALRAEHPFVYPLSRDSFHFTSRFGPRRRANGLWGFHYGLDMAAPKGTPVKAVAHGVVVEARFTRGFGNTVLISHSNKLKTRYAHLSKIDVKTGDSVEQSQIIGKVGNTGYTRGKNGIHLHFEVIVYGKQINPSYFL